MFTEIVAAVCIAWFIFIACVCAIGVIYLFHDYRQAPPRANVLSQGRSEIPHVTAIRPCKGLEPYLYECLASTFYQDYPSESLTIHFCVSSRADAAYPILEKVVKDHPGHDARIFVEEEGDLAAEHDSPRAHLGPNPKIRNMSQAYREAKGDLIWIIDCNVWVGRGICGRMVDRLCGFASKGSPKPYKLVHHLPISIDVDDYTGRDQTVATASYDDTASTPLLLKTAPSRLERLAHYGGRLEELFLSSSHAKMYIAINVVAVAPCIVGKSNMFRKSHLDYLTSRLAATDMKRKAPFSEADRFAIEARTGIDYFSHNICEDHLIGDLLWKSASPPIFPVKMRNHGLVYGDLAIQPVAGMTVGNYIARRVRWLRVRKFTVPVATLVEPGTESFLCSAIGAWGATTSSYTKEIFGNSWTCFGFWWILAVVGWASIDRIVNLLLHSGNTVELDANQADENDSNHANEDIRVPSFAHPPKPSGSRRPFTSWLAAWLGREALALPVWTWAIWGGVTVTWREKRFWVGMDMKVHEILDERKHTANDHAPSARPRSGISNGSVNGSWQDSNGKERRE